MAKQVNGMSVSRDIAVKIMSSVPQLDKLRDEKYYEVEDIITDILDASRVDIFDDVYHDNLCNDVVGFIKERYNADCSDNAEFISAIADICEKRRDSNISDWDNIARAVRSVAYGEQFNAYFLKLVGRNG